MFSAIMAVQASCAFADGTVSPPNPVGEAVWRSHLLPQLVPLAIFMLGGVALFTQWLVVRLHHKREQVGTSW
jgi:hypothetical protein